MKTQYKTLSPTNAYMLINDFLNDKEIDVDKYVTLKGNGSLYDEDEILILRKKIYDEMEKKLEKPTLTDTQLVEFSGGKWFRQIMHYDKNAFADIEFWLWLSVKYFREYIKWRASIGGKSVNTENFGLKTSTIKNLGDNVLYRMWVRAEIGYDNSLKDPYEYVTVIGKIDYWQSFVVRRNFANVRNLSQSFTKKIFEKKLKTEEHRIIGSWLTGIQSNLMFDSLSKEQAEKLIDNKIEEMRKER